MEENNIENVSQQKDDVVDNKPPKKKGKAGKIVCAIFSFILFFIIFVLILNFFLKDSSTDGIESMDDVSENVKIEDKCDNADNFKNLETPEEVLKQLSEKVKNTTVYEYSTAYDSILLSYHASISGKELVEYDYTGEAFGYRNGNSLYWYSGGKWGKAVRTSEGKKLDKWVAETKKTLENIGSAKVSEMDVTINNDPYTVIFILEEASRKGGKELGNQNGDVTEISKDCYSKVTYKYDLQTSAGENIEITVAYDLANKDILGVSYDGDKTNAYFKYVDVEPLKKPSGI